MIKFKKYKGSLKNDQRDILYRTRKLHFDCSCSYPMCYFICMLLRNLIEFLTDELVSSCMSWPSTSCRLKNSFPRDWVGISFGCSWRDCYQNSHEDAVRSWCRSQALEWRCSSTISSTRECCDNKRIFGWVYPRSSTRDWTSGGTRAFLFVLSHLP